MHCRHLPALLAAIDAGADGATAFREYEPGLHPTSLVRHLLSRGYRWLFRRLFDVPFRDPETGCKFFVRERILPVVARTRDVGWFWDHAESRNKIAHDYLFVNYVCTSGKHYPLEFRRFKKREQCDATGETFQNHTVLFCELIAM